MTKQDKSGSVETFGAPVFLTAMTAFNPGAAKAWMDVMAESARFMTGRLHNDLETQKAILGCTTQKELMKIQSEFIQTAMEQYAEETKRMFEMLTEATAEIFEGAKSDHAREFDDVPI